MIIYKVDGNGSDALAVMPETKDVDGVVVGDYARDCFGRVCKITKIMFRGFDKNGNAMVHFMLETGNGSWIDEFWIAGKVQRTVPLTAILNSHEVDLLEQEMRKQIK